MEKTLPQLLKRSPSLLLANSIPPLAAWIWHLTLPTRQIRVAIVVDLPRVQNQTTYAKPRRLRPNIPPLVLMTFLLTLILLPNSYISINPYGRTIIAGPQLTCAVRGVQQFVHVHRAVFWTCCTSYFNSALCIVFCFTFS